MLAWFCARSYIWGERQLMSKTAAKAAVSTECGFANGAAERTKEAFG
jgi:hypothetical protein